VTAGLCCGARLGSLAGTRGLGPPGSAGFYGIPVGAARGRPPAPADVAGDTTNPILGIWGGADAATSAENVATFDDVLTRRGVEHRFVTYEGAPHSFFDKKAADFADASAGSWEEVLTFIRGRAPSPIGA